MTVTKITTTHVAPQVSYEFETEIINAVNVTELLRVLNAYRAKGGRRTYAIEAFWRAYLMRYLLNLSSINELHRRLENDLCLRQVCGFDKLPERRTFNRFVERLSDHPDLVRKAMADFTERQKVLQPDLGKKIAIDSSVVESHSNPDKKSKITGQVSDPEASWTRKPDNKGVMKWWFGDKLHLMTDTDSQFPLAFSVTTAKSSDTTELPKLLEQAENQFDWFKPQYVIADRGYDSETNHKAILDKGGAFICGMRHYKRPPKKKPMFTKNGNPFCFDGKAMRYVGTIDGKHYFQCSAHPGNPRCQAHAVVDWRTEANQRVYGPVFRGSREWRNLYRRRQSVERIFKSAKEFRSLENHYIRGLKQMTLHAAMSVLTYAATVFVQTRAKSDRPRWMVKKVA